MNLQKRFRWIIAGSIIIPLLTMLTIPLIVFYLQAPLQYTGSVSPLSFRTSLKEIRNLEELIDFLDSHRQDLEYVLMDEKGNILASHRIIGSTSSERGSAFHSAVGIEKSFSDNGDVTSYSVFLSHKGPRGVFGPLIPLIILVVLFLFLITMSTLTLRSVRRSILTFEDATRRVSEGDLSFSIDIPENDTFSSLALSFETMRDRVWEEYNRRTRFFMGVSHDLKTPLSSISGYTDALLDEVSEDPELKRRYLEIIRNKSHLLLRRINRLIEYIRITNGEYKSSLKPGSLKTFLVDFLAMQKEEAGFSGKELEVEIELEENRQLRFDPDLLGRAIENLLQNAFAYGRPGTPVTISCRQENEKINFSIANQIESAPEEDELPLLFEPFYRGDSARHGDGFGLGLASVKSIVDAHGWSISARLMGENVLVFMIEIL